MENSQTARARWTLALYIALGALHLIPIWSVTYLPTVDGPTHVYNAWVMHSIAADEAPAEIGRAFRIDWRPHPNWISHLLMAAAMTIAPPLVAEKLLVSGTIAVLLAGAWVMATANDRRGDVYAFLALPFVYAQTLVAGYYNYSLSVGLFLLSVGWWWRWRDRPSGSRVALLSVLLVVCYFTHPLASLLAFASIALSALLTARRPLRRHFAGLLALLPLFPLLLWFGTSDAASAGGGGGRSIEWGAARVLYQAEVLISYDEDFRPVSISVAALYGLLIVLTLLRERRRGAVDVLGALVLLFAASMFWLPAGGPTRDLFTQRMSLFIFLTILAWLTPHLENRQRAAVVAAAAILALANLAMIQSRFQRHSRTVERFVRRFDAIAPETTVLILWYERPIPGSHIDVLRHAFSYVALEKRAADLSNYEPATGYFPIAFRPPAPDLRAIEGAPENVNISAYAARAHYVITRGWPGGRNHSDLQALYRLAAQDGEYRVYRRRRSTFGGHDTILLPLLGTKHDLGAPEGARWRVEQTVRNDGPDRTYFMFRQCLSDTPCDIELKAGQTVRIATAERRFASISLPSRSAGNLTISTVARRADVDHPQSAVTLPAVHERAFRAGGNQVVNIPVAGEKVGIRVYVYSDLPRCDLTLRLLAHGSRTLLVERRFSLAPEELYEDADLKATFGDLAPTGEALDIEIAGSDDCRVWLFATSADRDGRTEVHLPVSGDGF